MIWRMYLSIKGEIITKKKRMVVAKNYRKDHRSRRGPENAKNQNPFSFHVPP